MAYSLETIAVSEVKRYSRNARMHSNEQVSQLVNSIREYGFTNPILIDGVNCLIAGHGRLAAAERLGMEKVPAIRLTGLTENQIKALRIADNQLALNSSWDLDLLTAEMSELHDEDYDLSLIGFDDKFLNELLDTDGFEEDEALGGMGAGKEEPQEVAISVGPYRVKLDSRKWNKWETAIRAKVGFEKSDIEREILKRLGFE